MERPSWITVRRHDPSWLKASDIVGLRSEPTLYYSDDDIRGYQSELQARAARIDAALHRIKGAALGDWEKAKAAIQQFVGAKPTTTEGAWALPFLLTPFGLPGLLTSWGRDAARAPAAGLVGNKVLWGKGVNAERVIEIWESNVAAATGQPAPLPSVPPSWSQTLSDLSNAPQRLSDSLVNGPGKAAKSAFDDAKPYVIGGGVLVALVAIASLVKSVKR